MSSKKMLIVTECFAGGVYKYLKNYCSYLESIGYSYDLIIGTKEETPDLNTIKDDFNYKNMYLQDIRKRSFKNLFQFYRTIKDVTISNSYEIVHLHSSLAGFLGRFGIKETSKKFYTPHGYSFIQLTKPLKSKIYKCIEKFINKMDKATTTIAISDSEGDLANQVGNKVDIVKTGLTSIPSYIERRSGSSGGAVNNVISIGRLADQKNPILFLDIAELLPSYNFTWVGDGPLRSLMEGTIRKRNLHNVTITGWLDFSDVEKLLVADDYVYLQTSLWEGLPLTLLEALAASLPVVVMDSYGNRDVVSVGENGFICNNVEEFVESIKIVSDKYNQFSQKSYEIVSSEYNFNKNIKKLVEIYDR
ncbi:glycosyltransferase [Halobacillus sp. ACCC02827]|uniref:glycosyltransferase n=1 Tax=Halobacillus sp. ACCC02827 TaxID=3052090 RepID=UPI0025708530|nr:glycosyltransferase [Halobacillus sp. ACCC02827]WJE15268.1 glycosyltransferase [Halobacillus sp. ACCC02827]